MIKSYHPQLSGMKHKVLTKRTARMIQPRRLFDRMTLRRFGWISDKNRYHNGGIIALEDSITIFTRRG
jgi:hypothetical protein